MKNKKILLKSGLLLIFALIASFVFFINFKSNNKAVFKPITVSDLKSYITNSSLPRKDINAKRTTEKENGYSITSAAVGNIDSPISFNINGGDISFTSISNQTLGGLNTSNIKKEGDKIIYENLYNGINLIYTPSKQGILEEYEVRAKREINYLVQKIDLTGLTYKTQSDGSIIFNNSKGEFAFAVPKPVMYEEYNTKERNFGLHYEIFKYQGNTYLAKVIDKAGHDWLTNKAHYPVMIDATVLLTLFSYTSYPTVNNNWQIGIQTVGTGDLTIKPSSKTTLNGNSNPNANTDLYSLTISCDGNNISFSWDSNSNTATLPNFSCNGDIVVNTKVNNITKQNSLDFTYSGVTTTVESIVDTGKPIIVSSSITPPVVKVGDTITISAEVADANGVSLVTADIGGIETLPLSLISGNNKNGIWQAAWRVHNTITKEYEILINASNSTQNTTTSIGFFDPYTCLGGGDHAGADWNPATDCPSGFAGDHSNIGTLNVSNGQTATVQAFDGVSNYGTATMSASTTTIAGTITANGKGYTVGSPGAAGNGPGGGNGGTSSNNGGSYGGLSAGNSGSGGTYGSLSAPIDLGSGGGSRGDSYGGNGGGALKITTTGTLTVNGTISSNGTNGTSFAGGGGSGGSVYLTTASLAGNGTIQAIGGNGTSDDGSGTGGGGGRIAIYYTNANTYSGAAISTGGAASGGSGTVFIKDTSTGDLLIPSNNGTWKESDDMPSWNFHDLTINGNVTFQATNATLFTLTSTGSSTLASGITITTGGSYTNNSNGVGVYLNLTGDVTLPSTSTITANGKGYTVGSLGAAGNGPGGGNGGTSSNNGGSYGGLSAGNSGSGGTYGSLSAPIDLGSGGGSRGDSYGGNGGGALKITTTGTLTVNGTISSNGTNGTSFAGGGGSGGSVYLTTASLAGNGTIQAIGGNGTSDDGSGTGGGGGRIAIYYTNANTYSGAAISTGGAASGGSGTVFIKDTSTGDLLIPSNNGTWKESDDMPSWNFHDLTINGNVTFQATNATLFTLTSTGSSTLASGITITTGGSYTNNSNGVGVYLNLTGDVTLPSTSTITANGKGYTVGSLGAAGNGPGGGNGGTSSNNGGSYGGLSAGNSGSGGTYGSLSAPIDLGSGGGSRHDSYGGNGGGALKITTTGTLTVNGTISSNGTNGTSFAGGGGSGGSVYLTTASLAGNGTIQAIGGNGTSDDGSGTGGGGGRIALYCSEGGNWTGNNLSSANAAMGGNLNGSKGTVYTSNCYRIDPFINGNTQINGNIQVR